MNEIEIIEWTCVWTMSLAVGVFLIKICAKWRNL